MRSAVTKVLGTFLGSSLLLAGCGGGGGDTPAPAPGPDTTPAQFSFIDQTGVATSTEITSAPVTITGIDTPAAIAVSGGGGSYSINDGAFTAAAGTVSSGNTVRVRHTSSASAGTAVDTTLTVGGVSDVFTSTTADAAVPLTSLLPFLTGTGEVRLLDPTVASSDSNPVTVDTGLATPPAGTICNDCFRQAETFFTATVSGTNLSNLRAARLAYVKRGGGNNTGGLVYRVDLTKGASNAPARISALTDACTILRSETTDFANVDTTAVVIERVGSDGKCGDPAAAPADPELADNTVTVIRLNTPITGVDSLGIDIPLVRDAGNPLHARTGATGAVLGYVSFEIAGADSFLLVRRDADLANPTTLQALGQTTGANLERADLTRLYATATPVEQGMKLFRIETSGSLSPALHSFAGFNAGNPIQDGLRDATHLYFTDDNRLLRIPVDSTTENATVITTLVHPDALDEDPETNQSLRIGNRALDASTTPGRVVFEAQDDSITVAGGVFSAATTATDDPATVLANNADSLGGFAVLEVVAAGRAYINIAHHGGLPTHADALKVNTDGTVPVTTASAYWAGSNRATSFDLAADYAPPVAYIFLGRRVVNDDSTGTDTLYVVNPADGVTGAALGSVDNASVFLAINVHGLGTHALARIEKDRSGFLDYDVYSLSAATAGSLTLRAATFVTDVESNEIHFHDLPLDSLQRLTGNLCLLCL